MHKTYVLLYSVHLSFLIFYCYHTDLTRFSTLDKTKQAFLAAAIIPYRGKIVLRCMIISPVYTLTAAGCDARCVHLDDSWRKESSILQTSS